MADQKFHDAGQQPRWRIQGLGSVEAEFVPPSGAGRGIHLSGMSEADDGGEKFRRLHRLLGGEVIDLDLEVLRQ